jgi:hypothetical protein
MVTYESKSWTSEAESFFRFSPSSGIQLKTANELTNVKCHAICDVTVFDPTQSVEDVYHVVGGHRHPVIRDKQSNFPLPGFTRQQPLYLVHMAYQREVLEITQKPACKEKITINWTELKLPPNLCQLLRGMAWVQHMDSLRDPFVAVYQYGIVNLLYADHREGVNWNSILKQPILELPESVQKKCIELH